MGSMSDMGTGQDLQVLISKGRYLSGMLELPILVGTEQQKLFRAGCTNPSRSDPLNVWEWTVAGYRIEWFNSIQQQPPWPAMIYQTKIYGIFRDPILNSHWAPTGHGRRNYFMDLLNWADARHLQDEPIGKSKVCCALAQPWPYECSISRFDSMIV